MGRHSLVLTQGGSTSTVAVVRWSALSLFGRQAVQLISAVILARILGPDQYGVIAMVSIYVALSLVVLDQGIALALIQKDKLAPGEAGAAATVNIALSCLLGVATVILSSGIADFFNTSDLAPLLNTLGWCLVVKGVAIVPRALLSRELRFKPIAYSDTFGALVGAACGITFAMLGGGVWAFVVQTVTADLYVAAALLIAFRGPVPNLRLGTLRGLFLFSIKIFASNLLLNTSRRIDDILIGRYLTPADLAYYGVAYRVLMFPVQLLSGVVNRAVYPLLARRANDAAYLSWLVCTATRILSVIMLPGLALVILTAPVCIPVVFGPDWAPAVPVVQILAVAGARQGLLCMTGTIMTGLGKPGWQLGFSCFSVSLQVLGIVIGLNFGIVGVAIGYSTASLLVTPVMIDIQRRLIGLSWPAQLSLIGPALHGALWGALSFGLIGRIDPGSPLLAVVGTLAFTLTFVAILGVFHRSYALSVLESAQALTSRSG